MDAPKPLIVTYNTKEHRNLLFYVAVEAIFEQATSAKQVTKLEERSSFHPKLIDTLSIIGIVDEAKVFLSLLISRKHRTI